MVDFSPKTSDNDLLKNADIMEQRAILSKRGTLCHASFPDFPKFMLVGLEALERNKPFATAMTAARKAASDWLAFHSSNKLNSFLLAAVAFSAAASISHIERHSPSPPAVVRSNSGFHKSEFSSRNEAFKRLLGITEGKSRRFYEDNVGIAVGYGWNPTTTPKSINLAIADAIGMTKSQKRAILAISDDPRIETVPYALRKVRLTDRQLDASVKTSARIYEKEFLHVLELKAEQHGQNYPLLKREYEKLPYGQQAVLLHMVYKVGAGNLMKYDSFFKKLFVYLFNPNEASLSAVSKSFEYVYDARDGERKSDYKVAQAHKDFFLKAENQEIAASSSSPLIR